MSLSRKSTKAFTGIMFLLGTVLLLHLTITPMAYTRSSDKSFTIDRSADVTDKQTPFHFLGRYFIVVDFAGIELLKDIEINQVINRNLRDFQRLLNRTFNALVFSAVGLGIVLYDRLFLFREADQHKPILSTSIGGHAPPRM